MKVQEFFKRSFKYIRELSVIVIGIAITLGANNLISRNNDKDDLQRYLDAVHLEIEMNNELTKDLFKKYTLIEACSKYLNSVEAGKYNVDSLKKHRGAFYANLPINYSTNAFEMLKTSGLMRLIKDDSHFKSIISCYSTFNEIEVFDNALIKSKDDIQQKMFFEYPNYNSPLEGLIDNYSDPIYKPMYIYMRAIVEDAGNLAWLCSHSIEQTLALFPE